VLFQFNDAIKVMSSESTELSFIRCPSCRSLVPSLSTRCRMCGYVMKTPAPEQDVDQKKINRVRQRTMSTSQQEVKEVIERIRDNEKRDDGVLKPKNSALAREEVGVETKLPDQGSQAEKSTPLSSTLAVDTLAEADRKIQSSTLDQENKSAHVEEESADKITDKKSQNELNAVSQFKDTANPLAEFITLSSSETLKQDSVKQNGTSPGVALVQDLPSDASSESRQASTSSPDNTLLKRNDKGFSTPFMELSRAVGADKGSNQSSSEKEQDALQAKERNARSEKKVLEKVDSLAENSVSTEPVVSNEESSESIKQKSVVATPVSSTSYTSKSSPRLKFGSDRSGDKSHESHKSHDRSQNIFSKKEVTDTISSKSISSQNVQTINHSTTQQGALQMSENISESDISSKDDTVLTRTVPETKQSMYKNSNGVSSNKKGTPLEKSVKGRLFGWLVSYSDPNGVPIELREGKMFVTNEAIKENDIKIESPSVSTPHAMFVISTHIGFQIHDLMSEGGVHLKKRQSADYTREEDTFTAEHGDWLKFGDVEFLVALIAHVGEA
jgi:hypothetical protein